MKNRIIITIVVTLFISSACLQIRAVNFSDSAKTDNQAYERIKNAVDNIWLVDTHEHLVSEKGRLEYNTGFFYLMGNYFRYDHISAGMPEADVKFVYDDKQPVEERWKVFQPWWNKTKNTGYGLCVRKSVQSLFGIDEINENTWKTLNSKLLESNKEGWYSHVLKDKARIDVSIVDPLERYGKSDNDYPDDYFLKVKRFDNFIKAGGRAFREAEEQSGTEVRSLNDYLMGMDTVFTRSFRKENFGGIKSGLAYGRSLYFEDVSPVVAGKAFDRIHLGEANVPTEEYKALQDFMMHHILGLAARYHLPIQIHTGMLAGNWNSIPIENTNARLLSNLFLKHRDVKFVIFHGSYPYMDELAYLTKSFPNVYIDMCWKGIISPSASRRYLEEWLFTVSANKIMAFGGDIGNSVEWVYGHAEMTREIVAWVLTKMVAENYYTEEEAKKIAGMILHENALELYKIKNNGDHFYSKVKFENQLNSDFEK